MTGSKVVTVQGNIGKEKKTIKDATDEDVAKYQQAVRDAFAGPPVETETETTPEPEVKTTLEQVQEMSKEEMADLFDEVYSEKEASENVPETSGEPSTKTEVTLPPKTGPTTTTGGPRPPKTTTEIAKEGGIGAIKAVEEAVKGLNALFGDPNTLRSGPCL